jgi:hypothetical protein
MRTRIIKCTGHTVRELDGSERVLHYKLEIGRLGQFFAPPEMPPFEGRTGFVDVIGPNTRIKVLRQCDERTPTRDATPEEHKAIYTWRRARVARI